MSDQAFIIQPNDVPRLADDKTDQCSRCLGTEQPIVATAKWNSVVFRYCAKCAEGK